MIETNVGRDDIPEGINLLVICGPRRPFQPDEVERIKAFIVRGGQLILLLGNAVSTGLDDLLRTYNIGIGPGLVADPRYNLRGSPFLIYAPIPPEGPNQPIVDSMGGRVVLLPYSAPLNALGGPPKPGASAQEKGSNPGVVALPFLKSGPESWLESTPGTQPIVRDAGKDAPGPVTVGIAVFVRPATPSEKPTPRMVVFSGAGVADNQIVRVEPANLDLLMNAIHWLRGRPELIGIDSKTHESLMFAADPGLRLRLVTVPSLLAAVVIIGLGATTYFARRD